METDSLRSWFILANCFMITLLNLGFIFSTGSTFVLIQESYSITRAEASLPINTMSSSYFSCALFTAPILYFLNVKKALTVAVFLQVAGCFLCYASPVGHLTTILTLGMACRGVGMSLVRPICMECTGSWFTKHRAKAFMILQFTSSVAALTLPDIDRLSSEYYGLRGLWIIKASIVMQSLIFVWLTEMRSESSKLNNYKESSKSLSEFFKSTINTMKNPAFSVLVFGYTMLLGPSLILKLILIDFGRDTNTSRTITSMLLGVVSVGEIVGRLISSVLLDKKILKYGTTLWVSYLLMATTFAFFPISEGYLLVTLAFLSGVTFAFVSTAFFPLYTILGTNTVAFTYGASQFVLGMVLIFVPNLIGYFRDNGGRYNNIFYIIFACTASSSLVFFVSYRPKFDIFKEN